MVTETMVAALAVICLAVMVWLAIPACPTEDSNNCLWDAQTQGNGRGQSFIDINGYLIRF